jgi:hypothetical protein
LSLNRVFRTPGDISRISTGHFNVLDIFRLAVLNVDEHPQTSSLQIWFKAVWYE